ncbi:MAG: hypothetical protein AAFU79_31805, partial [Myxococcota bacterium]
MAEFGFSRVNTAVGRIEEKETTGWKAAATATIPTNEPQHPWKPEGYRACFLVAKTEEPARTTD